MSFSLLHGPTQHRANWIMSSHGLWLIFLLALCVCSTVLVTKHTLNKPPFNDWLTTVFISISSRVLLESQPGSFVAASSNLLRSLVVRRHVQSDRLQIPEPKESESIVNSNCFKIYQQLCSHCVQCVKKLIIFLLSVLGGSTNFGKTSLLGCSTCCPLCSRQKQQLSHWRAWVASPYTCLWASRQHRASFSCAAAQSALVLSSEQRGLKALVFPQKRLEVHNASQPSFNLFCFVRWWR